MMTATMETMTASGEDERYRRGMALFERLDPATAGQLAGPARAAYGDLGRLAVAFGYGDVMARPGLDLRMRELVNVAILGALGHCQPQLESHVAGALRAGASEQDVREVVLQLAAMAGFPAAFNAMAAALKAFGAARGTA
jgi:4-carboxymuconolactone decarboxylase